MYGLRKRFSRRTRRGRGGFKRRRVGSKTRSTYRIARAALNGVRRINKGIELKYATDSWSNITTIGKYASDWYKSPIENIFSGIEGTNQAIGRSVSMKTFRINGQLQFYVSRQVSGVSFNSWNRAPAIGPPLSYDIPNYYALVRVWVLLIPRLDDVSQIASILPTVWEDDGVDFTSTVSLKNFNFRRNTKVLMNKLIVMNSVTNPCVPLRLKVRVPYVTIGNTPDHPDQPNVNVLVWGITTDISSSVAGLRFDGRTRLTYTDA